MERQVELRKVSEFRNETVKFTFAEITSRPGQFAIMATQGLQRIVIQGDRKEMLLFVEAVARDIREH